MLLLAHEFGTEADACFEQAERLNASDPRWPYLRGLKLAMLDRAAAVPLFERAADRSTSDPAPRLRLAETQLLQGRLDSAEQHFRKVLELAPHDARAELGLARIALKNGDPRASLELLRNPLVSPFSAKAARTVQVEVLERLGDDSGAQKALLQANELPADLPWPDEFVEQVERLRVGIQARLALADQISRQGRGPEALEMLQEIIDEGPDSSPAHFLKGEVLLRLNQFANAEAAFRQAAALAPDSSESLFQLGNALFLQKKYKDAAHEYRQAIDRKGEHALAHYNLGHCLVKFDQSEAAIAAFRESLRFQPDYAPAHMNLADLLAKARKDEAAISHLESAIRLAPRDQRARDLLEAIRSRQGSQPTKKPRPK